ncbi:MAG TPA: hypothetical protein ENK66_05800 [Arcobacter sp.]|nr:hypothetical protein [Arcobacter sp.]
MIKKLTKTSFISLTVLMVVGCVEPQVTLPNKSEIQKVNTDYSNSLEYLDSMINVFNNGEPMVVVVTPIEDKTASQGKVPQDITDIVKTSFNKIGDNVVTLFNYDIDTEKRKVYLINGAITEFDVVQNQSNSKMASAEFGAENYRTNSDGSLESGNKVTKLALNFNPADPDTGTYIARTSTSNKITIYQKQSANEFAFSILGSGFGFSNALTKTQGLHSSITVLAELSVAEVLGKLGKFPYWLVTHGKADKDVLMHLSRSFLRETVTSKIRKISYLLTLAGYPVRVSSVMTPALKDAIVKYKISKNINPNDFITKELYLSLLSD